MNKSKLSYEYSSVSSPPAPYWLSFDTRVPKSESQSFKLTPEEDTFLHFWAEKMMYTTKSANLEGMSQKWGFYWLYPNQEKLNAKGKRNRHRRCLTFSNNLPSIQVSPEFALCSLPSSLPGSGTRFCQHTFPQLLCCHCGHTHTLEQ